jgi:uncharacterized protein (TIGR02217 family)
MSIPVFPLLASGIQRIGLPYKKWPEWNTAINKAVNFREVRIPQVAFPKWHFSLNYAWATGRIDDITSSISNLIGFYTAMQGSAGVFAWNDLLDNTVTAFQFGTGDGTSKSFQLIRPLGPTVAGIQPIDIVQLVNGTPSIFKAGTLQTLGTAYSISSLGVVTFVTAPTSGQALTWTGNFYFALRFSSDQLDSLEMFAPSVWQDQTFDMESVLI